MACRQDPPKSVFRARKTLLELHGLIEGPCWAFLG